MRSRKSSIETVAVEALSFADTAVPDGPPPSPRGSRRGGIAVRIAAAAAVLAVAVAAVVVVVSSDRSNDDRNASANTPPDAPDGGAAVTTTSASVVPTTGPRPIASAPPTTEALGTSVTDPEVDLRVALLPVPDGYVSTFAQRSTAEDSTGDPWQLFVADGATWSTGPWLLVVVSVHSDPFAFRRPPQPTQVGAYAGWVGPGRVGDELTSFDVDRERGTSVAIASLGMPPGTGAAVGAAMTFSNGSSGIPAAAIGDLRLLDSEVAQWFTGTGLSGTRAYDKIDGSGSLEITATATTAGQDRAVWADASFFLSDERYAVIDGHNALAGTFRGSGHSLVTWQEGGRRLTITTDGTIDEALVAASDGVLPSDSTWNDSAWDDGVNWQPPPIGTPAIERSLQDAGSDSMWSFNGLLADGSVQWTASGPTGGLEQSESLPAPLLSVASPGGLSTHAFAVVAFAVVDRATTGAVLRITANDPASAPVEVALHPVPDAAEFGPYLVAGASVDWTSGGYLVELVAPDGTVIASRTDADAP